MTPTSLGATGNGQAHRNMQPYLGINFIIAWDGVFPSRP
jgi:microcystin-dependent protein